MSPNYYLSTRSTSFNSINITIFKSCNSFESIPTALVEKGQSQSVEINRSHWSDDVRRCESNLFKLYLSILYRVLQTQSLSYILSWTLLFLVNSIYMIDFTVLRDLQLSFTIFFNKNCDQVTSGTCFAQIILNIHNKLKSE